jgi:hypothetical protein
MQRRKFSREHKLEAMKLMKERGAQLLAYLLVKAKVRRGLTAATRVAMMHP